ncbi:MAG: hypothetical protein QM722_21950 [Piscinibacter sp.]
MAKWLAIGNVVLTLVLTFLVVKWRSESNQAEQTRAREAVSTVALALAQGVHSDLVRVDGVLKSSVAAFERAPQRGLVDGSALAVELPDLRAGLLDADALLVCDADGNVRMGIAKDAPPVNLADRDFFIAARSSGPSDLPVVSGPWVGRVSGKWGVSIARPLRSPNGQFAGTVHATLGSEYFARRLASVPLGQDGIVALRSADLSLIARVTTEGLSNEGLGSANVSAALKAAVAARPMGGDLVSRSPRDGVERAVAYQRVPGFPLYVIVGQGTADLIADGADTPRASRAGAVSRLAAAETPTSTPIQP